jgi:hypothetical protein
MVALPGGGRSPAGNPPDHGVTMVKLEKLSVLLVTIAMAQLSLDLIKVLSCTIA